MVIFSFWTAVSSTGAAAFPLSSAAASATERGGIAALFMEKKLKKATVKNPPSTICLFVLVLMISEYVFIAVCTFSMFRNGPARLRAVDSGVQSPRPERSRAVRFHPAIGDSAAAPVRRLASARQHRRKLPIVERAQHYRL